jgi:ribosomal-protein-alanine N-acetyltransferase
MIIREMTESDLDQICRIEQASFSEPWNREDFFDSMKNINNRYLVADIEGEIAGYCGYWGIAGEGCIYNIAVKEEYRGQRIGYQLLSELIRQGYQMGITAFTLEVRQSNTAALSLYERLGFEGTGIRKDFYSKPKEDAVIMWLKPIQ